MLVENLHVRQDRPDTSGRRRWFESEGLELVFWFDAHGAVEGFQICYERRGGERALTWRAGRGFAHATIDSGDTNPLKNETPVLIPDGEVPWVELTQLFRLRSG